MVRRDSMGADSLTLNRPEPTKLSQKRPATAPADLRNVVVRLLSSDPEFRNQLLIAQPMAFSCEMSATMQSPKIVAYLKPSCGWSQGVRAVMRKYNLPFEDRDIINDPTQRQEMIVKSGQMLSPCVEVNGNMLADVSGEEVERWMLSNGLIKPNEIQPDAPINQPCAHEMPGGAPLPFRR